ncbi:hypothetical protein B0H14DRAFT_3019977, partial [Mycena olivaceomarginata]
MGGLDSTDFRLPRRRAKMFTDAGLCALPLLFAFLLTTECLLPVKPSSCPAQIPSPGMSVVRHPHSPPRSTTDTSCMPAAKYGWTDGEYFGHLDAD